LAGFERVSSYNRVIPSIKRKHEKIPSAGFHRDRLLFDLLFWKKAPGISFPLFVLLGVSAGWIC
jgi:hypothetical protein